MRVDGQAKDNLTFEDAQMKTLGNMIKKIQNRKNTEYSEVDAIVKNLKNAVDLMRKRIVVPQIASK